MFHIKKIPFEGNECGMNGPGEGGDRSRNALWNND